MKRPLVLVLFLALALRILAVGSGVSRGVEHLSTMDDYLKIAANWMHTGDFPAHALFFPPLYPLLCRTMIQFFGAGAVYGVLAAQVLLGTATVFLVQLIARRVTGSNRAALVAGVLAAVDPLLLVHTPMILTETLYTFMLVALVAILVCLDATRRWHFLLLGIATGLALLSRSVGLVLWPVLVFFWFARRWPWPWFAAMALVAFALCLPRMWNNHARFGRFEVTASGKYNISALWIGQAKALVDHQDYGANLSMWGIGGTDYASTFAQADVALPRAIAWAEERPMIVAGAVARGVAALLLGSAGSFYTIVVGHAVPVYSVGVAAYRGLLIVVALVGLRFLFRRDWRLALLIGGLLVVHTLAPGAAGYSRFAVPGETLEIVLAAVALERLFNRPATAANATDRSPAPVLETP